MLVYPNTLTLIPNPALATRKLVKSASPAVSRGNVSVTAERRHLSLIVYSVDSERVKALLPAPFQVEETIIDGRAKAWVSVESFFDQNAAGQPAFEQTNYLLHVLRDGMQCHWLLGASLGSLSAVGARNPWPMPWHLSAMEFRAAYDEAMGRYSEYSLQTQSQWANSAWQIRDTGWAIDPERLDQTCPSSLPASLFNRDSTTFFARRDGSIGSRRIVRFNFEFTRGELRQAKCDLLEQLGLLKQEELLQPAFTALQHKVSCQIFSPAVLQERRALKPGPLPFAYGLSTQ